MAYAFHVVRQLVSSRPAAVDMLVSGALAATAALKGTCLRHRSAEHRISVSRLSPEWLRTHEIAASKRADEP